MLFSGKYASTLILQEVVGLTKFIDCLVPNEQVEYALGKLEQLSKQRYQN